jgi:hypothetical protein
MTAVARHFLMLSRQPELGFVVIKPASAPGPFRMAFGAGFPQSTEVRVVFLMAIDTTGGRFPEFFTGGMAVAALDGTMFALENEIRSFMIEGFQIQLNDVRGPSFMIGVTVFALATFHLGIDAMKPFFLFEVDPHRLVARQALLVLPTFFKQDVTLDAFRLVFDVTLDNRPRHQKLFIRIGKCLRRQQHDYSCQQSSN